MNRASEQELAQLQKTIHSTYEDANERSPEAIEAVEYVISQLDCGGLSVVTRENQKWVVHEWVKKAILLYFRFQPFQIISAGELTFYDKIPLKKIIRDNPFRVVPHAVVRRGAYIAKGAVLMPSYVNIGAYVGEGTMVDTWATVGSCARVGKGVHLSGGVGLGGVLEPLQAKPVIVGDHAFIGSRAIIVEGAEIGEGAVIAANTCITGSTRIIDVRSSEEMVTKGFVPPQAIVIPGTSPKEINGHKIQIPCAYIIGTRNESTDKKVSLNSALREHGISV